MKNPFQSAVSVDHLLRPLLAESAFEESAGQEVQVVLSQMYWAAQLLVSSAETQTQSLLELSCALTNWFVERKELPQAKAAAFQSLPAELAQTRILSFLAVVAKRYLHGTVDRDLKSILYRIQKMTSGEEYDFSFSKELFKEILSLPPQIGSEPVLETLEALTSNAVLYRPIEPICHLEPAESYRCVVCHPLSLHGFHIEPRLQADGTARDHITFPARTEGYNGIVHGGFLMMLLDEILVYSLVLKFGKVGLTTKLETKFLAPVRIGQTYELIGRIESFDGKSGRLSGEITQNGKIFAQASGEFLVPGLKIGERIFGSSVINQEHIGAMFLRDE